MELKFIYLIIEFFYTIYSIYIYYFLIKFTYKHIKSGTSLS